MIGGKRNDLSLYTYGGPLTRGSVCITMVSLRGVNHFNLNSMFVLPRKQSLHLTQKLVGYNGVEPLFDAYQASVLTVGRISHTLVEPVGIEPTASTLSAWHSNR